LIARNSSIDAASINQAVKSVENSSEAFQRFISENPEYLKELTAQMGRQLMPVVQQVDEIAKDSLEQMDKQLLELNQLVERERIELSQLLASERGEITLIIDEQRDKVAQELDVLIERAINNAISQLQTVVEDLIIYLIALIVVLLFSPVLLFYLGFRLGKNRSQPSQ
jgi:predicted PurR-regulated permease PerM